MLVDVERAVYLPLYRGGDCVQPDAVGRPAQTRQDAAQGPTDRFRDRASRHPQLGPAAAAAQRLDGARPRPDPYRAAGRADELLRANVGDLRRTDEGAVIHVRGKGGKDRRVPIEPALVQIVERYLDSRATRFPATAKRRFHNSNGCRPFGCLTANVKWLKT